jgi:flagellar hook protein FlgE
MMRALYSAISGLNGFQTKMDVLGNNIANVDTSGFKSSSVVFATALSQALKGASAPSATTNMGGTNAVQIGLGQTYTTAQNMTEGSAQTTGINTNLMLQGPGYFVVHDGTQTAYTRAGDFNTDNNGTLVDPSGAQVQGYSWGTDDTTTPQWSGTGFGNISNLQTGAVLPGDTSLPVATATVLLNDAPTTGTYTPETPASAGVAEVPATYVDSTGLLGAADVKIDGMTEVSLGTTPTTGQFTFDPTTGTITFASGFVPPDSTTTPPSGLNLSYVTNTSMGLDTITPSATNANIVTVDYPPAPGAIVYNSVGSGNTQYKLSSADTPGDGEYTVTRLASGKYQITFGTDGTGTGTATSVTAPICYDFTNAPHTLSSFSIDPSGVITGVYTNGEDTINHKIAQIATATFSNESGLMNVGGNLYTTSSNSGAATVGEAGLNGQPAIESGALEMSNVNLAQEFTDMIIAQRGFQANSRVITVGDSILGELVDLKRQ